MRWITLCIELIVPRIGKVFHAWWLLLLALLLVLLLSPLIIPVRIVYVMVQRGRLDAVRLYFLSMAIGIDQLGGSVLYGTQDYTVSAATYMFERDGYRSASYFRRFIDAMFGKDHCANAYYNEVTSFEEQLKEAMKRNNV